MCSPARCARCGKTSWTGCGRHAEQVLAAVPPSNRCTCLPPASQSRRGWFSRHGR